MDDILTDEIDSLYESLSVAESDSTDSGASAGQQQESCVAKTDTIPIMNYDVLHQVLRTLDRRSLLRTLRTCRGFYSLGLRVLLESPIFLDHRNFKGFCRFILADRENRGALVRDLTLLDCSRALQIKECVIDFLRVLQHVTALRKLCVAQSDRVGLNIPLVLYKIITLPGVHDLELLGVGRLTQTLLDEVTIQAETLALRYTFTLRLEDALIALKQLSRHESRLRALEVYSLRFDDRELRPFTHLQELCISTIPHEELSADRLIYLFPNLSTLVIMDSHSNSDFVGHEEIRNASKGTTQQEKRWSGLTRLMGPAYVLHALGLTCTVRCLKLILSHTPAFFEHTVKDIIQDAITDCHPTALEVSVGSLSKLQLLSKMQKHTPYLTHLSLEYSFSYFNQNAWDEELDLVGFVNDLFKILSPLSLEYLEIHFEDSSRDFMLSDIKKYLPQDYLGIGTPTDFMARLMDTVPTLNTAYIVIPGCKPAFFRVSDNGSGRRIALPIKDMSQR
ncbi:unnamed protein product [Somion occarium]